MTIPKKVTFIEKIDKTQLGLNGLQTVVYCDKSRLINGTKDDIINEKYNFCKIGHKILKVIDGEFIRNKYNLEPGKEFGRKLHEERVKWLKHNINKI